jgi:glycosyltransferase involved in cell wall biosynthesis
LPVIVTPVGGLSEQVQHGVNGLISANVTADSVAKSIECLLIDNSLYHKISSGALESANTTYSWKESVLSIKEIWRYLSGK